MSDYGDLDYKFFVKFDFTITLFSGSWKQMILLKTARWVTLDVLMKSLNFAVA
jgi:hypothetical protein